MGRKIPKPVEPKDPTAWILDNGFAEFVLLHTNEIVSVVLCFGVHLPVVEDARLRKSCSSRFIFLLSCQKYMVMLGYTYLQGMCCGYRLP